MTEKDGPKKLWAGRFREATDSFVARFTASVHYDQRLAYHDIKGSIAHATMLRQVGVLSENELNQILGGLQSIQDSIDKGEFKWSADLEDVHMNIEAALTEQIGAAGKKLHTGRSRNDQVATDIRLYLRDEIDLIANEITMLQKALLSMAKRQVDTIMPGFTHLQIAQPVTLGHHLMAWYEMIERDYQRLQDCRRRVNIMPLGSAALAGTDFPIDRSLTADLLGFACPSANSLDSVSDRDFAIEFAATASVIMMHLSRWSEELVLWVSPQFAYIELPDRFCTGSSIMPQKKNPDVVELIRGKSGRVYGDLMSLLTLMKGQPLAYNRDNQEDKEPLFDVVETTKDCIRALADIIPALLVNKEKMKQAAEQGYATATDLADYLTKKELPFRDAHEVVGKLVSYAVDCGKGLSALSLQEMKGFSDLIDEDVFNVLTLEGSVHSRNHPGGTAPQQVKKAIKHAQAVVNER
ncbi:MAG: argininosuccinate lyase [Pseudomonadales bacterium]|jgi:argininosuccinate lyase|nr:argininosuccinate lyase [Pseudomonadales bacterium]MDP7146199.1 argininosuccinate lyase [Pseudomonadales bacterium]MDP7360540.1 argininosuccinate lyase [Pseudomonadales bacterium]MDP7598011.1 argininosuccinate lyase [Pseudomonadales bacterium]HJN49356.1 argininosuccinate lyase [Pseudomonadales bacterium]|tara:strand:- start:635 stop:2032 length:1398 start_codon:yes stop_codon:yes gene_type:complete